VRGGLFIGRPTYQRISRLSTTEIRRVIT